MDAVEVFVSAIRQHTNFVREEEQELASDLAFQLAGADTQEDGMFTMPYVIPPGMLRDAFEQAAEILVESANFTTARLRTSRS